MPILLLTKTSDQPAGLLGIDPPLARAIDVCQGTRRQSAVVAAVMVGCLRPALEGHTWAVSLGAAAAVMLASLVLVLVIRYQAIRDRAIELIAQGQDTLDVEAIQRHRRRLLRRRTQMALARCLDGMVRQATTPGSRQLRPAPALFDYRVIQSVGHDLQAIAVLLRGGRATAAELARLERLITQATSPLYGHDGPRLRSEVEKLRRVLADNRQPEHPGQHSLTASSPCKSNKQRVPSSPTKGVDMVPQDMVDHPDVQRLLSDARQHLESGDNKAAARILTDAAYHTHDPEVEHQVRQLAAQGREQAGRFSKSRWEEIIRIADLRSQRAQQATGT